MNQILNNTQRSARFISFEGGEGSGKSTNISYFCELLADSGIDYVLTREPGGTEIAEAIRTILLSHHQESLQDMTELLLVFAARAQHVEAVIRPALAAGQWVVCDRFTDATYVYQGAARGMGDERVALLEKFVLGDLRPDKTFLLDVPIEIGAQRAAARGELDRFEREDAEFFQSVREAYLRRAASDSARFDVIDASQPLDVVAAQLKLCLANMLGGEGA